MKDIWKTKKSKGEKNNIIYGSTTIKTTTITTRTTVTNTLSIFTINNHDQ